MPLVDEDRFGALHEICDQTVEAFESLFAGHTPGSDSVSTFRVQYKYFSTHSFIKARTHLLVHAIVAKQCANHYMVAKIACVEQNSFRKQRSRRGWPGTRCGRSLYSLVVYYCQFWRARGRRCRHWPLEPNARHLSSFLKRVDADCMPCKWRDVHRVLGGTRCILRLSIWLRIWKALWITRGVYTKDVLRCPTAAKT